MTVFLVGGGVDSATTPGLLGPFLTELRDRARERGREAVLAIAIFDRDGSGAHFLPDYVEALRGSGRTVVEPVFVQEGKPVDPSAFTDVDGIAIGGGPTPRYLDGLTDAGATIRTVVQSGVPYLGFSAGAMIAAGAALIGGYRQAAHEVCPEDWSEELDPITVRPGLGLVGFAVDVHTAQAGTLGRTVALVSTGKVATAVGIDEDTCLAVPGPHSLPADCAASGGGSVWIVSAAVPPGDVTVRRRTPTPPASPPPR